MTLSLRARLGAYRDYVGPDGSGRFLWIAQTGSRLLICGCSHLADYYGRDFPTGGIASDRHFVRQQPSAPNVRFGSKADILRCGKRTCAQDSEKG